MTTDTWNTAIDDTPSAVSWKAIVAGSTASIAISLTLAAFGVGVGFSVVSPWSDSGVSGTTFTIAAGVYLIVVAMLSSTIGGYLAGRLRSQWKTVHEHERYFRDSAHGFLVWAFAAVVSAAVLGGVFTHIVAGASAGLVPAAASAAQGSPTDMYVDKLLRADPAQASASATAPAQGALTSPAPSGDTAAPLQGGQAAGSRPEPVGRYEPRRNRANSAAGPAQGRQRCRRRPGLSCQGGRGPHRSFAARRRAARQPGDDRSQNRRR